MKNVILIDAFFLDALTQEFTRHFEGAIGRKLGKLDLCHWLDCLLLDAGVQEGENENVVAFIHGPKDEGLLYATPSNFRDELNGKAFKDNLGEFVLSSHPVEHVPTMADMMNDSLKAIMESEELQNVLVVGDFQTYGVELCKTASEDSKSAVTLFSMFPLPTGKYKTQILGFSVMSGLGIRADEL